MAEQEEEAIVATLARLAVILMAVSAFGQQARFDSQAFGPKGPLPNVIVSLCATTATGIPCSPQVTSTTDSTGATACSIGSPVTPAGSSICQGTTDALGNFGFWLTPGAYQYCLTGPGITGKCYNITDPVGADSSGNIIIPSANTLFVNNIRQQAGAGFNILDANGVAHMFISGTAPYVNTFIFGNGAGNVFLGSGGKANVSDTTGTLTTAGSITLQTTSQTLPSTIANDTLGGLLFTTNAGKGWQIANSTGQLQGFTGITILLQGATSGSVTIAVPAVAGSNTVTLPAATDTLVGKATTDTLTNKRVTPRQVAMADAVSVTPTSDTADINTFVSTQAGGTLTVNAPTGTPTDGQKLTLRLKSTNAQTYSFNATYAFSTTVTAPTTLAAGKTDYIGLMWNATNTKWDVVAVDQGH